MSDQASAEGSKAVPRREFVFILHDLLETEKFPEWLRWVPTSDGSPATEFQVTANPANALTALQALTSSKDLGNIIRQLSYWNFKRKTDIRAKPARPRDQPPEGFVTWSHTLPTFVQGDSSRLGEIKRNPTKGSRGAAKKAEAEAEAEAEVQALAQAGTSTGTSTSTSMTPVPDQPMPPPEPRVEESSPPRPVKRLKLTMKNVDKLPPTPPPAAAPRRSSPVTSARGDLHKLHSSPGTPRVARSQTAQLEGEVPAGPTKARARLEVDESLSGDVVDDKGVVRSFAAAPPTGTNFRNEIKWGRIQG